jgi:hypothetical protein
MKTTKTLVLAGLSALSLGVGSAIAQESAGGYIAGPLDQSPLSRTVRAQPAVVHTSDTDAVTIAHVPQYGASDRTTLNSWPVLQGGDGSGG